MFSERYAGRSQRLAGWCLVVLGVVPPLLVALDAFALSPWLSVGFLAPPLTTTTLVCVPLVWVGRRVRAGAYGPLAMSAGAIYGGVVVTAVFLAVQSSPLTSSTGPFGVAGSVALTAAVAANLAVPVLALSSARASERPFPTAGTTARLRWVWRIAWQPWVVVVATPVTLLTVPVVFPLGEWGLLLGLGGPLVLWIATAAYVARSAEGVLDVYRGLAVQRREQHVEEYDPEAAYTLLASQGGLPLVGSRWLVATHVLVGEESIHVLEDAVLDVQALDLHDDTRHRAIPHDRVDGTVYDGDDLVVVEAGTEHRFPCEESPEQLLADVERCRRDHRSEGATINSRITGRRPARGTGR